MQKLKSQFKIKNYFLAILAIFALVPILASAAEIRIDAESQEVKTGERFTANLFLDTEESINALEGQIVFPVDLLEPKEIRDGNSIVNFWIERPKIESDKIRFLGITPGGYLGEKGLIFSVVFQSIQEGSGSIEIQNIKALLNDGKGTEANTTISNLQLVISKQVPASQPAVVEKEDTDIPETFEPIVTSDPAVFDGKYFLVFATQDKGSGIDYYEIKESRQKFLKIFKKWVIAESPYLLKDRKLRSYVYIKAVDKAGNERITVVEPRYPMRWYEAWWILGIITLSAIIIGYLFRKMLWTRLHTK